MFPPGGQRWFPEAFRLAPDRRLDRSCCLASILEGRRDGGSSCGEDSGHLVPRKREEALYNDRIELGSTRLGEPANGFLERQTFTVRTRRNHGVKGVCH